MQADTERELRHNLDEAQTGMLEQFRQIQQLQNKMLDISETIHKHQARYSEELQQKLGDLNTAYTTSYGRAVIDVMRTQVKVLEARMDTLRDLEEEVQNIIQSVLERKAP